MKEEVKFNKVWNAKTLITEIYEARLIKGKWENVGEPLVRYSSYAKNGKTVYEISNMQKEKFIKLVSDLLDFYSKEEN